MTVLERSELDASSLADLHAIADQVGLDGFRRLRKGDLIDAILERAGGGAPPAGGPAEDAGEGDSDEEQRQAAEREPAQDGPRAPRRRRTPRPRRTAAAAGETQTEGEEERRAGRGGRAERGDREDRIVEGVVELLGNGSAFLRVAPPEVSDEDVYISAAQVRRCELVSGDRVRGPARAPRPSERYPSLARVDTINGASAESVAEGTRYEDLAVAHPCERLELDPQDPTLGAIEWLTPIGRGSRVAIVGAARAGKTETLRRLLGALAGRNGDASEASVSRVGQGQASPGVGKEGLEVMLVLSGVRPEEVAVWREGPVAPAAAVDLAASADLQSQTVEHVVDTAKRVAARGGDVVVLVDSLDGLHPHAARRVLAAARNLVDGGSLTVIATASRPFGGESTVIALDVALTSTGRLPALDLMRSGTVRPELLVGEDGAVAITKARAEALA